MTDDDLRELLTDAVSDVEPAYRLDAIKARTRPGHRRRGWYAAGGAILAAAAVVTAVSVVSDDNRPRRQAPATDATRAVGLYFIGDTPQGPRLYREFQQLSGDPLAALAAITTEHDPQDPDYRTFWPARAFQAVSVKEAAIEIEVSQWGSSAYGFPSDEEMELANQQLVYTVQAATGRDLPVRVIADGTLVTPLSKPLQRRPQNEVLAFVSISDPSEGVRVKDSFVARGRANSPEANVPWQIKDETDDVVLEGFATALGWGDRLYEWETERIDVSDLSPGRYTFVAMTDDPSGGEGRGPFTDTRTIIVD